MGEIGEDADADREHSKGDGDTDRDERNPDDKTEDEVEVISDSSLFANRQQSEPTPCLSVWPFRGGGGLLVCPPGIVSTFMGTGFSGYQHAGGISAPVDAEFVARPLDVGFHGLRAQPGSARDLGRVVEGDKPQAGTFLLGQKVNRRIIHVGKMPNRKATMSQRMGNFLTTGSSIKYGAPRVMASR